MGMNSENIVDYILIYGFMLLCVWQRLFSFYRYSVALYSAKKMESVSSTDIIKPFLIYATIFSILYLVQIHFYYYAYPIVIILFGSFNLYCIYKFSAMLIDRLQYFPDTRMVRHIMFCQNTSLISCVLQSIYLAIFQITYNVDILYYFPILYGVLCSLLAMNFVRNVSAIKNKFSTFKQYINGNFLCCQREQPSILKVKSCSVHYPDFTNHEESIDLHKTNSLHKAEEGIDIDFIYLDAAETENEPKFPALSLNRKSVDLCSSNITPQDITRSQTFDDRNRKPQYLHSPRSRLKKNKSETLLPSNKKRKVKSNMSQSLSRNFLSVSPSKSKKQSSSSQSISVKSEYASMDCQNMNEEAPSIITGSHGSMITIIGPDTSLPSVHSFDKSKSNESTKTVTIQLSDHGKKYEHEVKETEFEEIDVDAVLSFNQNRSSHARISTCPHFNKFAATEDAEDMLNILTRYGFVIWESFDSENKEKNEKKARASHVSTYTT